VITHAYQLLGRCIYTLILSTFFSLCLEFLEEEGKIFCSSNNNKGVRSSDIFIIIDNP